MIQKLTKKHLSIQKPFLGLNKMGYFYWFFFVILREIRKIKAWMVIWSLFYVYHIKKRNTPKIEIFFVIMGKCWKKNNTSSTVIWILLKQKCFKNCQFLCDSWGILEKTTSSVSCTLIQFCVQVPIEGTANFLVQKRLAHEPNRKVIIQQSSSAVWTKRSHPANLQANFGCSEEQSSREWRSILGCSRDFYI